MDDALEIRLQRLEAQLARLSPSVQERLATLEQQAVPPPSPKPPQSVPARFIAWMGTELPKLIGAAVLLVLGFAFKDSVDLAIKQRQLDLSYSKEMQGLLQKMSEQPADMATLQSTAVVLASYGEAALPALLSELRNTGLRADAAEQGLAVLALRDPQPVCEALPRILLLRSRQFDWQIHQKIVRMLGEQHCTQARAALHQYRRLVQDSVAGRAAAFEALVRRAPLAPAEEYPLLLKTVDEALRQLQ